MVLFLVIQLIWYSWGWTVAEDHQSRGASNVWRTGFGSWASWDERGIFLVLSSFLTESTTKLERSWPLFTVPKPPKCLWAWTPQKRQEHSSYGPLERQRCLCVGTKDIRLVIKDGKENQFFFHHGEGIFSWVSDLTGETLQGWICSGAVLRPNRCHLGLVSVWNML